MRWECRRFSRGNLPRSWRSLGNMHSSKAHSHPTELRVIEQNKERHHETLEQSSAGWHEGQHNPGPFVNYMLWILKQAYGELEQRVGNITDPIGAKAALVRAAIARLSPSFRLVDVEAACPGVGRDWIRKILRQMKSENLLQSTGHGLNARWERIA